MIVCGVGLGGSWDKGAPDVVFAEVGGVSASVMIRMEDDLHATATKNAIQLVKTKVKTDKYSTANSANGEPAKMRAWGIVF